MNLDETRQLRGGHRPTAIPLRNDDRLWVRWPVMLWHASGIRTLSNLLCSNYINVLLISVPLGMIAGALKWNQKVVFVLNFMATVPLASLLSFAVDELSLSLIRTGGVVNGVFGRPIDLIIGIVAVRNYQIVVAQSSMLGTIFFNILFVLGSSICVGGSIFVEQSFDTNATKIMSSFMLLASSSMIMPAVMYAAAAAPRSSQEDMAMTLSRSAAIILLLLYLSYLFFLLHTHKDLFENVEIIHDQTQVRDPQTLGPIAAGITIIILCVAAYVCVDYLISGIDFIADTSTLSKRFFGLILLPFAGNVAEYPTTCKLALEGKMDAVIELSLGNSINIAMFVMPLLVELGWIMERPMTLNFRITDTIVLLVVVIFVSGLVRTGRSNYLHGMMCVGIYVIIAVNYFIDPPDDRFRGIREGRSI